MALAYTRALLKLSGEALGGEKGSGLDFHTVEAFAQEIKSVHALGVHLAHRAGRIGDHDATIGRKLAWILAGGDVPHATEVSETYLLDLEREAFLSLCGEPRTQERMAYTLKTGKTLRN